MKKQTPNIVLIILCTIFTTVRAQTWTELNTPDGILTLSLDFIDANQGWVIDDYSAMRTTDGGITWQMLDVPAESIMNQVCFVNATHGWICTDGGTILHTEDGGETWVNQVPGTEYALKKIHFVDELHGWTIGFGPGAVGTFLYTIDGGDNWLSTACPCQFNNLEFIDQTMGWMVCNNGDIYSTYDGGVTIEPLYLSNDVNLRNVDFINGGIGWIVGNEGLIQNTLNGGLSWYDIVPPFTYPIFGLSFVTASFGAVSGSGQIAVTQDAGQTWVTTQFVNSYIPEIEMLSETIGYAVTGNAVIKYCALSITNQSEDFSVVSGESAELSIVTNDPNALYQWQIFSNNAWVNISDDNTFTGSSTNTLSISAVNNSIQIQCVVTSQGCQITSEQISISTTSDIVRSTQTELNAYPNPTYDRLQFEVPTNWIGQTYLLTDLTGRTVFKGQINNRLNELNMTDLASGTYFLRIQDSTWQLLRL
jgi:photosystem II stability/assembly factor-like uncharacterized protein